MGNSHRGSPGLKVVLALISFLPFCAIAYFSRRLFVNDCFIMSFFITFFAFSITFAITFAFTLAYTLIAVVIVYLAFACCVCNGWTGIEV